MLNLSNDSNNMLRKKTIYGVTYTAKFRGISYYQCVVRKCDGSMLDLAEILFDDILVSPKVGIDDFDNMTQFLSVYQFLDDVASGKEDKALTKSRLTREVRDNWNAWRLIYCEYANFTYDEVFHRMTPQEIAEANIALDLVQEQLKKATKKK